MEHGLTLYYRDISTPTVSATRYGPSLSRTLSSSWTTQTTSRPRESRSWPVKARRRRSERCIKGIPSSQRGEYCCIAEERGLVQQQHRLYAEKCGKLWAKIGIVMLSGSDKRPCDMAVHQKAEGNMLGCPNSELRCLEMHQAVSFLLRHRVTILARIRRAELLNDTHAEYVNGDEND